MAPRPWFWLAAAAAVDRHRADVAVELRPEVVAEEVLLDVARVEHVHARAAEAEPVEGVAGGRGCRLHLGVELGEDEPAHGVEQSLLVGADVAQQFGFFDQSHLNKAFKQAFLLSPVQFQRRML